MPSESDPSVKGITNSEAAPEEPASEPKPTAETSQENSAPAANTSGSLISDLGFRPEQNGFVFPNYGGEPGIQNLTPAELQRMFGDQACARMDGGACVLTPPGQ